jgi:hypothetical protein
MCVIIIRFLTGLALELEKNMINVSGPCISVYLENRLIFHYLAPFFEDTVRRRGKPLSPLLNSLGLMAAAPGILSANSCSPPPPTAKIFLTHSEVGWDPGILKIFFFIFCQNGLHFRQLCMYTDAWNKNINND